MECLPWPKSINYALAFLKVPNPTVSFATFEITPGILCSVSCSPIQEWQRYYEARPREDHEDGQGIATLVKAESAGLIQLWEVNLTALFSYLMEYSKDAKELDSSLSTGWQDKRQQTLVWMWDTSIRQMEIISTVRGWSNMDTCCPLIQQKLHFWRQLKLDKVLRNLP